MPSRSHSLTFLIAGLAVLCAFSAGSAESGSRGRFAPGELLVGLRPGVRAVSAKAAVLSLAAGTRALRGGRVLRVRVRAGVDLAAAARRLQAHPGVAYVEPNPIVSIAAVPNDPDFGLQWGPARIGASEAYDLWRPEREVVLAIIDTGVDYDHPDLAGVLLRDGGGDVVGYNAQTGDPFADDDHFHGTHCAGIAAAATHNATGVAGVAGWSPTVAGAGDVVRIMPVKVLSSAGVGTDADVADGIDWAVQNGADVLSLSVGGGGFSQTLADAVADAWAAGCVVICAAGNNASNAPFYPAYYAEAIAVAATNGSDTLASFSNWGDWVDTAAPGVSIRSTLPGTYGLLSGTSMACPHVSGLAALLLAHDSTATNADVRSLIETQTQPYQPYNGRTLAPGAGRIHAGLALQESDPNAILGRLVASPGVLTGGGAATVTLYLRDPAPPGGTEVGLSSSTSSLTAPASVIVPEGLESVQFAVSTSPVAALTQADLSATFGAETRTATFFIQPPVPSKLTFTPATVAGSLNATLKVTLTGAAPAGGLQVALTESHPAASGPASVTVAGGALTGTAVVNTTPVTASVTGGFTASYSGKSVSANLTVRPISVKSVVFSPGTITGGDGRTATGTVTLEANAAPGDITVTLSSAKPEVAQPSVSLLVIPAGQQTGTFATTPEFVSASTTVSFTAAANGLSKKKSLTVKPVAVALLALTPSTVQGGSPSSGDVTLNYPAGPAGVTVTFSSSNSAVAAPASPSITIPQGQSAASVAVATQPVGSSTGVTITAAGGGVSKAKLLTVTP